MQWYYSNSGQRSGPISAADFERLVQEGVIRAETLVWREGMAEWKPYATIGVGAAVPVGAAGVGDEMETCAVSGKRFPRREMVQYEGKWISAEHRDAFFQRMREGVVQPGSFVYGGFWRRFGAKVIDNIISYIASSAVNAVFALLLLGSANTFTPEVSGATPSVVFLYTGISMLSSIGIGLAYVWFFVSRYDATPGKMALGLKLVRPDGSSLGTGRIIGRYFAEMISGLILFIGYIMAAFDEEKRALHDRICDTRVIKVK